MPNDPTGADRQRRWRERQAGRLAPAERPPCQACGRLHTGAHGPLCSRCWERLTPDGRADRADRVARAEARAKPGAHPGNPSTPITTTQMDPNTIALSLQQIDNLTAEAMRRQRAYQAMAIEVAAMLARSSREVEALADRRQHLTAGLQSGSQP